MIGSQMSDKEARRTPFTVEHAIYAGIFVVAVFLRFWALGRAPLSSEGVQTALGVLGRDAVPNAYSGLLYAAQALFFSLLGASATSARLLPAVIGTVSLLIPLYLRHRIGRWGGLGAAILLMLSPCWLFASRTASGAILVGTVSLAWLVAGLGVLRGDKRCARAFILLFGFGFAAGGAFAGTVVGGAIAAFTAYRVSDSTGRETMRHRAGVLADARAWFLAFALFHILASAFWTNLDGIAATFDSIGQLFAFEPGLWWQQIAVLFLYEPLLTLFAIYGIWTSVRKRSPVGIGLGAWLGFSLLYALFSGQVVLTSSVLLIVPAVTLAGMGLQHLVTSWPRPDWRLGSILVAMGLFFVFGWLSVASYVMYAETTLFVMTLIACGIGLIAGLALASYWANWPAARTAFVFVCVLALLVTVRSAVSVCYQPAVDPGELLLEETPSVQVGLMEEWLHEYSAHVLGDGRVARVAFDADMMPWARWAARDFDQVMAKDTAESYDVLISVADPVKEGPQGMIGQAFIMTRSYDWPAHKDDTDTLLRWLLWREPVADPDESGVQVWVWAN